MIAWWKTAAAGILAASVLAPAGSPAGGRSSSDVRVEGRTLVDDDGPFTVLGASLFWGAWGYRHDRARLERNLEFLAGRGVDAIRVFAAVGPSGGWDDRVVDPRWPDYEEVVGGLTDLAFDRYGLRVQWTIFGGVDLVPTPASREALVGRIGRLLAARANKVLFVEIANEGYQNGFGEPGGLDELRGLGRRLSEATPLLVALTAPQNDEAAPFSPARVYDGATVPIATLHHDRDVGGPRGAWRPVRAPWSAVGLRDVLPPVLASNEPIGPSSSVAGESDPMRLAGAALVTWLSGHSVYVFHAGPGVRGGGAVDLELGRPANFDDGPVTGRQLDALANAQRLLPADIAAWTPVSGRDAGSPLRGEDVFCAVRDAAFRCVVLLRGGEGGVTAGRALTATGHDPLTGAVVARFDVGAGQQLPLAAAPPVLVLDGAARAVLPATMADRVPERLEGRSARR